MERRQKRPIVDCILCRTQFDVFKGSCPACNWSPDEILDETAGYSTGEIVNERYKIQGPLRVGCFDTTINVFDLEWNISSVIKIFHPGMLPDSRFKQRFLSGAKGLTEIEHAYIAGILDCGIDRAELCYVVCENAIGKTLRQMMEYRAKEGLRFSLEEAISLVNKIAAISRDIPDFVHGSLSPERIWPASDYLSSAMDFKITGYGIVAHLPLQAVWHRMRSLKASRGYAPPEFLMDRSPDKRTDVFAMGVMIGELLTQRSFEGQVEVFRDSEADFPGPIFSVVEKALSPLPSKRYPDLESLAEAFSESMEEPITRVVKVKNTDARKSWIEPKRPTQNRLPSYIPPKPKTLPDDPNFQYYKSQAKKTQPLIYSKNVKSPFAVSTRPKPEPKSVSKSPPKNYDLDGIDPKLLRAAAHSDRTEGIDPRLLRAAAKLHKVKTEEDTEKDSQVRDSSGPYVSFLPLPTENYPPEDNNSPPSLPKKK